MAKDTLINRNYTINCKGRLTDLSIPKVMGILNVTPDSFYDGGQFDQQKLAQQQIEHIISEGADFIDVGACSTRPGAKDIGVQEEKRRLEPVLEYISYAYPDAIISIDTYRSAVARWAVENYGVAIVNDVSGGDLDERMFATIAELKVPYILMHMKGTPQNMQQQASYDNVNKEIIQYLARKGQQLHKIGVHDVIVDPGIGFGKTIAHNFEIIANLELYHMLPYPLMIGVSRKSMIYKTLKSSPDDALNGTTALNTMALLKGANILRVHDVKPAREAVTLFEKYRNATHQIASI